MVPKTRDIKGHFPLGDTFWKWLFGYKVTFWAKHQILKLTFYVFLSSDKNKTQLPYVLRLTHHHDKQTLSIHHVLLTKSGFDKSPSQSSDAAVKGVGNLCNILGTKIDNDITILHSGHTRSQ